MKYMDATQRMREAYPHAFTDLDGWADFLEMATVVAPLRDRPGPGSIALRHDVDHNLDHALGMARWEADRGFRATYFVLPGAWYAAERSYWSNLRELEALGHEVGIHNDTVALTYQPDEVDGAALPGGFCWRAADLLDEQISALRDKGLTIVGSSSHGNAVYRKHGVHNSDLWAAGWTPADFDLEYEAYHLHRRASYISDNQGRWQAALKLDSDRSTHVSTHPAHWALP